MKKTILTVALSAILATGCQSTNPNAYQNTSATSNKEVAGQNNEARKLEQLVTKYFEESLKRDPVYATFVGVNDYNDQFNVPINQLNIDDAKAFEQKYLKAINAIDASSLSGQDLLTYQIFKRDRELAIEGFEHPSYLVPYNQMYGVHNIFAMLGSGSSAQPFNTAKDYRDFIKRAAGFATFMDSTIVAMRKGVSINIVLPKPIVEKVIPQLAAHVVEDVTTSVFYGPVKQLDSNTQISEADKATLKRDYIEMIKQVIIPTYKKSHDFVKDEYAQHARSSVGLSALPNGKAWYEYKIKENTTLPLSAEEIHQYGKKEVARILTEMQQVKRIVKFDGTLPEFFAHLQNHPKFYFDSEQAVIDAYNEVKQRINERVPQLFNVFPKADYEVRAVEAYRAASSAGASYQSPAPDGSRPGIFYINTHNLKAQPKFLVETLSIHEAAPGHHFQISIQQEVEGLPEFRKFGGYTVFAEGWALYAESLGKEMGLFTDPYMWYGRLVDEQLRAMRLVVDTGLHAFGWTREEAIRFMADNSSMAHSDIVSEVERYISIPGQALAYKLGERAIRKMREKAADQLGDKFDIKAFHTQILIDGALPMPILEQKIDRWIESQL
ncbi:DUF885 domain-containing protein [Flocculibacter collagenilyticus]|uniref:DUF885 domain-containing protein n=1 Tax=Flocculibacter collagenilyticus TaxID=2744479 RepID=UPI0018F6089A|nr:DUF885 domain-containing protein [Flocculibacter collagenilyticus]